MKKIIVLFIQLGCLPVFAETIRVGATDYAPYSIHSKGSGIDGLSVKVVHEALKRAKLESVDMAIPVARVPEIAEKYPAIFPHVGRSKEREAKFQWIGKIASDEFCFAMLKGKPAINSLDEAKKLKKIVANTGGLNETLLVKAGFTNLEPALGNAGCARKLFADSVDAWFSTPLVASYSVRQEGKDPKAIECHGKYFPLEYWVAVSLSFPKDQVEKLQKIFETLQKEGFIQAQIDSYK